jgi:hypothetical protein
MVINARLRVTLMPAPLLAPRGQRFPLPLPGDSGASGRGPNAVHERLWAGRSEMRYSERPLPSEASSPPRDAEMGVASSHLVSSRVSVPRPAGRVALGTAEDAMRKAFTPAARVASRGVDSFAQYPSATSTSGSVFGVRNQRCAHLRTEYQVTPGDVCCLTSREADIAIVYR